MGEREGEVEGIRESNERAKGSIIESESEHTTLKNVIFHFRDFPTFTNSTNLQIFNK